jgi:hypothetical protein
MFAVYSYSLLPGASPDDIVTQHLGNEWLVLWSQIGWMVVAVAIVACVYNIDRVVLRNKDRQIDVSLEVMGLVNGRLIIEKFEAVADFR